MLIAHLPRHLFVAGEMDVMEVLNDLPWIGPLIAALVGLQIGSFLNVLVWRLPQMMQREWDAQCAEARGEDITPLPVFNLATPGSSCPHCHTRLRVRDLVPVLSFVLLKGRCAHCHAPVSWRYPLVETLVMGGWAFCVWHWGWGAQAIAWSLFATVLLALALIDADTMLLPDGLTLPLMWAGMLLSSWHLIDLTLMDSVWGAAAGYGVLWAVQTVFALITGKQGMGEGDFKLLAALGAWLGWVALPVLVLLASVGGVCVALAWRGMGRLQPGQPMPFGPYLAAAGALLAVIPASRWYEWTLFI